MRHNGQPRILASKLQPDLITLFPGEHPTVACPRCGRWRVLRRGMVAPHKTPPRNSPGDAGQVPMQRRCWGSGQRITVDLSFEQWLRAREEWWSSKEYAQVLASAAWRRPTPVRRTGKAPTPPALTRMAS